MKTKLYQRCARIAAAGLLGLSLISASEAWAQESLNGSRLSLGVGSRVRLRCAGMGGELQGFVAAVDDSDLTLVLPDGPSLKVPVDSITAAEIRIGQKRATLKGLVSGALLGVVIGLTAPVDPSNCAVSSDNFCSRGQGVSTGAVGGAAIGALIGAFVHSDRWAPVQLRGAGTDRRAGLQAGVALRF